MHLRDTPDLHTARTRREFIDAFNDTMLTIWKERIIRLRAIDTGRLFRSVTSVPPRMLALDSEVTDLRATYRFPYYGTYVERGVGPEMRPGADGHIRSSGRRRKAKPWLTKKYGASVLNLRDFLLASISSRFIHIVSDTVEGTPTP